MSLGIAVPPGPVSMTATRKVLLPLALAVLLCGWYVDPGSTSLIWQLVISGVVGVGFTARRFFRAMASRIRGKKNTPA